MHDISSLCTSTTCSLTTLSAFIFEFLISTFEVWFWRILVIRAFGLIALILLLQFVGDATFLFALERFQTLIFFDEVI